MRIKSITVGNFKNIAETTLNLNRMVSLVSTNNYGKSNLLEAIRFGFDFITASTKVRNNMMHWSKGISLCPILAGKEYIFSIEFDDSDLGKYRFVRYGFKFLWFNDQGNGAEITDEAIEIRSSESVRYTSYLKRDKGQYRASKSSYGFRKLTLSRDLLAIDVMSAIDNIDISNVITKIKHLNYNMCSSLELNNSFQPDPIEFDFGTSDPFYDDDIPRSLSILKKDNPNKYKLFVETIYDLFPEFRNVDVVTYTLKDDFPPPQVSVMVTSSNNSEQSKPTDIPYHVRNELYKLVIDSSYLNQPISMELMSTGTKRIFWLIAHAIFSSINGTNLLGIDEIETSIHPRMIRGLLESLTDIIDNTSMIVTSHSPYLIQYLKPESIYVGLPNSNGTATFRRIQHSKLKPLLATTRRLETSIGEYLFELMSGDCDSMDTLQAYLED